MVSAFELPLLAMFNFVNLPAEINQHIESFVAANTLNEMKVQYNRVMRQLIQKTKCIRGAHANKFSGKPKCNCHLKVIVNMRMNNALNGIRWMWMYESFRYNKKIYLDSLEKAVHVMYYCYCVKEIRSGNFNFVRRPPEFILQDSNFANWF